MIHRSLLAIVVSMPCCFPLFARDQVAGLPIPDKTVVLTFDDGNKSDVTFVAPLLKKYGFGATFYITPGWMNGPERLHWDDVRKLQQAGFEIGNHSVSHPNFTWLTEAQIREQIETFDAQCADHDVRRATTFAYPGGHHDRKTISTLADLGYHSARRGNDPEYPLVDEGGPGMVYAPGDDDPFLIPSTFIQGPIHSTLDAFKAAVAQAKDGKIAILTFHGVPDVHPHCSTPPEQFHKYVKYLHEQRCNVVSMGALANYVDLSKRLPDPYAPIKRRLAAVPQNLRVGLAGDGDQDERRPVFSWHLTSTSRCQMQTAYQILVATSQDMLKSGVGDVWDSGKVESDCNFRVAYAGQPLARDQQYWWAVRSWSRTSDHYTNQIRPFNMPEMIEAMQGSLASAYVAAQPFVRQQLKPVSRKHGKARGIASDDPSAPWIRIAPLPVDSSPQLEESLETYRGTASYRCRRSADLYSLAITLPANMKARVQFSKLGWEAVNISSGAAAVWENGKLVDRINGIDNGAEHNGRITFDIGSGTYQFYVTPEK